MNLLVCTHYAGARYRRPDIPDMRKAYRYKIVCSDRPEAVEKDVNACLEQFGYELYGSPYSHGGNYVQALVKSEDVSAVPLPSTLRSSRGGQP